MSLVSAFNLIRNSRVANNCVYNTFISKNCFSSTTLLSCKADNSDKADGENNSRDPLKDRSQIIPVETSIRYLQSSAYKITYGEDPVWKHYRRNFKGQYAPRKTRKRCIRNSMISTGNPCPICRDEYLVLHETNVDLLKQFISPYTGEVIDSFKTGVCQRKQQELLVTIERAKNAGAIIFDVPFREYDYSEYGVKG